MYEVEQKMIERAKTLLESGEVKRVIGWTKGEFYHDPSPATFESVEDLKNFVYNGFCGANLSKYLINESKKEGKTAIFLKPCDTYSFNQLVKEHRIKRENILVIAIECLGKVDIEKIKAKGITGITEVEESAMDITVKTLYGEEVTIAKPEVGLEKCLVCAKKHQVKDEEIIFTEIRKKP